MTSDEFKALITVRDFIRYATSCFNGAKLYYGHGTDNAWDDASNLVLHTLHLPHHINPTILDARVTEQERITLAALIRARVEKKIPVAYLIHEAWFAGQPYYVDERVLIPRSPIAELILNHFEPWLVDQDQPVILDLCTGSACIAIACAFAFPLSEVDASDLSNEALAVAKINVEQHNMTEQVTLHESNLFEQLPPKKYDLIVSNPPYVSTDEMAELPNEYHHEPTLALAAGKDGLDIVERILRQASQFLKDDGILVVEVGNSEVALAERYPTVPFTWLEFENGGGGVFLLTADELKTHFK